MLTRDDQTVVDCLQLVDEIDDVPLAHIGFKDVGVEIETLKSLHGALRDRGVQTYLEVVSTTKEAALRSARAGRDLGVDWLMGGIWVPETLEILDGCDTRYLPFPGNPVGHPTVLGGTAESVAEDTARYERAGAAGVDILAFRATEADPMALIRAARNATSGRIVVAGSINNPSQIKAVKDAGADGFTIGQAALSGTFTPSKGTLRGQLQDILESVADSNTA